MWWVVESPTSHFELYLEAMDAVGANTGPYAISLMPWTLGNPSRTHSRALARLRLPQALYDALFDVIERGGSGNRI